jgi:hypothetical protein
MVSPASAVAPAVPASPAGPAAVAETGALERPEALPTDAPPDRDALGDALASGALAGSRREPPTPGVAAAGAPILAELGCPACGRVGLRYVPFTRVIREAHPVTGRPRTRLSYRAFGRCRPAPPASSGSPGRSG